MCDPNPRSGRRTSHRIRRELHRLRRGETACAGETAGGLPLAATADTRLAGVRDAADGLGRSQTGRAEAWARPARAYRREDRKAGARGGTEDRTDAPSRRDRGRAEIVGRDQKAAGCRAPFGHIPPGTPQWTDRVR